MRCIRYICFVEGIVIKSTGSWYTVRYGAAEKINCKIKGSFKIKGIESTNPLAVGDRIEFEFTDEVGVGVIHTIHERKNYIIRKSINLSHQTHIIAANIDHAFLVATIVQPRTSTGFIDRFLMTAEAYHIPVSILFNKSDLYGDEELQAFDEIATVYQALGYPCYLVSALDEEDVAAIRRKMNTGINLLSGHSGVGKSTLINAIEPNLELRTSIISAAHKKGTHTTTFAEMFELRGGGFIVDTPGIKELGIVDMQPAEIGNYFPEMRAIKSQCKFHNCIHVNEPKCAVKAAVEHGDIALWRYSSYLSVINKEDYNQ